METITDVPMVVLRRHLAADLVDLLALTGDLLRTRGASWFWCHAKEDQTSTRFAADRLRRSGLIAIRRTRGRPPLLTLTADGRSHVSDVIWPERWWRRRWEGQWYAMVYDVPEKQRHYRVALQGFLRRMRLGCLQKSVWITPWDIRAEFDDLRQAAAVSDYAFLFKFQPTLGQRGAELAARAWNFERLNQQQKQYLADAQERDSKLSESGNRLVEMRQELGDYCRVMAADPLLPEALYPSDYQGRAVVREFRRRLRSLLMP